MIHPRAYGKRRAVRGVDAPHPALRATFPPKGEGFGDEERRRDEGIHAERRRGREKRGADGAAVEKRKDEPSSPVQTQIRAQRSGSDLERRSDEVNELPRMRESE